MESRRATVSKTLLRNIIRHTDTHNRVVEEEECWRQYEAQKARLASSRTGSSNQLQHRSTADMNFDPLRTQPKTNLAARWQHSNESLSPRRQRAHMDDTEDVRAQVYGDRESEPRVTSTFWLKQFDAAESQDPDRWGHSGYKQLYPSDFESSDSEPKSSSESSHGKRKHNDSHERHRKSKKKKKKLDKKRHKDSESSVEDKHTPPKKKKKKKQKLDCDKKKKKKKKHHKD